MTPDQYCAQKAAPRGSTLHYGLLYSPVEHRRAVSAVHALRDELAGTVGTRSDQTGSRARLGWWRTEIDRIFDGEPEHLVGQAIMPHVAAFGIERSRLVELVDGIEMDMDQTRYLDFEGLRLYLERVGGSVAVVDAGIFAGGGDLPVEYARNAGVAMQLVEIIRDVGRDARHGRIYIPHEDLQRFEVPEVEILKGKHSDRLVALMRFQAERARGFLREAFEALPREDRRAQRPGLILANLHARLLDEIERDGFHVLRHRVSLTPMRKHLIAWRAWLSARPVRLRG